MKTKYIILFVLALQAAALFAGGGKESSKETIFEMGSIDLSISNYNSMENEEYSGTIFYNYYAGKAKIKANPSEKENPFVRYTISLWEKDNDDKYKKITSFEEDKYFAISNNTRIQIEYSIYGSLSSYPVKKCVYTIDFKKSNNENYTESETIEREFIHARARFKFKYKLKSINIPQINTSDPSVFSFFPNQLEWQNNTSKSLLLSNSQGGKVVVTKDNNVIEAFTYAKDTSRLVPFRKKLFDGTYKVEITENEIIGIVVKGQFWFRYDATKPSLIVNKQVKNNWNKSGKINATASDGLSGVNSSSLRYKKKPENAAWSSWQRGSVASFPDGVNQYTFEVYDNAGNRTEVSGTVQVDTIAPSIQASVASYAVSDKLTFITNAGDGNSGIRNVYYSLNDKEKIQCANNSAVSISVKALAEGNHTIKFYAEDNAGNEAASSSYTFKIVRKQPKITAILQQDKPISENEYIYSNALQLNISTDTQIQDYYWYITQENRKEDFSKANRTKAATITVSNIKHGLTYLIIKAIDIYGNESNIIKRKILRDAYIPGLPLIKSPTHKQCSTADEAVSNTKAEFVFKPAINVYSGVAAYRWKLYKGNSVYKEGRIDTLDGSQSGSLEFVLPDNQANEYYILNAACIAGNKTTGQDASYKFRIDTDPPKGLRIDINPHTDSANWYNEVYAKLTWNIPKDMTGVEKYAYCVSETSNSNNLQWIYLKEREANISLESFILNKTKNTVFIHVACFDNAGNSMQAVRKINLDIAKPQFIDKKAPAITALTGGNAISLNWGRTKDNETSVEEILVKIINMNTNEVINAISLEPSKQDYTIDNLPEKAAMTIYVECIDAAGNRNSIYDFYATGGAVIPASYSLPYSESINGFYLEGSEKRDTKTKALLSYQDLEIKLPQTIAVPKKRYKIASAQIHNGQLLEAISSPEDIQLEALGFTLKGRAFRFNRFDGLYLNDALYKNAVNIGSVHLGSPEHMSFSSEKTTLSTSKTVHCDNGLSIEQVEWLYLDGQYEYFGGNNSIISNYNLPVANARIDSSNANISGDIKTSPQKPAVLKMQNIDYHILKADFKDNYINIQKAYVLLSKEFDTEKLFLENFTIDTRDGKILCEDDFKVNNTLAQTKGNVKIKTLSFYFDEDGRLKASTEIDLGVYGIYQKDDIIFSADTIDYASNIISLPNEITVHGFQMLVEKAYFSPKGLHILTGKIQVFNRYFAFADLGIEINERDKIYQEGRITTSIREDTGYGAEYQFINGRINKANVNFDIKVPLSQTIQDSNGNKFWEFKNAILNSNYTIHHAKINNKEISIGSYNIQAENISLDNTAMSIEKLNSIKLPDVSNSVISFDNLRCNYTTVLQDAKYNGSADFELASWKISFKNLLLDEKGVGGEASLRLPENLGGHDIMFSDLRIDGNSTIHSGSLSENNDIILYYNIPVKMKFGRLIHSATGYNLVSEAPEVIHENTVLFSLGKTAFDTAGNLKESFAGQGSARFVSSNNYFVDSDAACLKDGAALIKGKIGSKHWEKSKKNAVSSENIYYSVGNRVKTNTLKDKSIEYSYNGWELSGSDVEFSHNRTSIYSNTVQLNGKTIDIGKAEYTSDGILFETAIQNQNVKLTLPSGLPATITETRWKEDGLYASMMIGIPSWLEGTYLYFENVLLKSDGSIDCLSEVKNYSFAYGEFSFNAEGIRLNNAGLQIEQSEIILPAALSHAAISVSALQISNTGIVIESGQVAPFALLGLTLWLDSIAVNNDRFSFEGGIRLPDETPGVLSRKIIQIDEFSIGTNGQDLKLIAKLNREYYLPLIGAFAMNVQDLVVEITDNASRITMAKGELLLPSSYGQTSATISDVRYNIKEKKFDFSEIKVTSDIVLNFSGLKFAMNMLRFNSNGDISFDGFVHFPKENIPPFLAGRICRIDTFEILSDGSLGNLSIHLNNLEGSLSSNNNNAILRNGNLDISKEKDMLLKLSIKGDIELSSDMPDDLKGLRLAINEFIFDIENKKIKSLDASLSKNSHSISNMEIKNLFLGLQYQESKNDMIVSVRGGLIFPSNFPDFLAGQTVELRRFEISVNKGIQALDAKYELPKNIPYTLTGDIMIKNAVLAAVWRNNRVEFEADGLLYIPKDTLISGVGELSSKIRLRLNSLEGLSELYFDTILKDSRIYDTFITRGIKFCIDKKEKKPLLISLKGDLEVAQDRISFIDKNLKFKVNSFTIDEYGNIKQFDVRLNKVDMTLFGQVAIKDANLVARRYKTDDFIIAIDGRLGLVSELLPETVRNSEFVIKKCEISTKRGLLNFDAGLITAVKFSIFTDISVNINALSISSKQFTIDGSITLPDFFPDGLKGRTISLQNFAMDWKGIILDMQGAIDRSNFDFYGFKGYFEDLFIGRNESGKFVFKMKNCDITLPSSLKIKGSNKVGIKNAFLYLDSGKIAGQFMAGMIPVDIAGFTLELIGPYIDDKNYAIGFAKATLKSPEILKTASVSLNEVSISAKNGLQVQGGEFLLPAFTMGTLTFYNVRVGFLMQSDNYEISGSGSVILPGAGSVYADVSFTNVSDLYPIGLQRAIFTYTIWPGILLGGTGLRLNAIRGSIAYGPPNEVPEKVQGMFSNAGPRISLGLGLVDAGGGNIITMVPSVWVDLHNGTWALDGKAIVLKGVLDLEAEALASVGKMGFYAGMDFKLKFVKGGLEFYIFDKNEKVLISGEGRVQFGISRGSIVNKKVLGIRIVIPRNELWLPRIGAEFGAFKNGKSGFKGFVRVPILGDIGVFVGGGSLKLGNVSSYKIEKPTWARSLLLSQNTVLDEDTNMMNLDSYGDDKDYEKEYPVYISKSLDRAIFVLAHIDGEPQIEVQTASGKTYRAGDENTELSIMDGIYALTVYENDPGLWKVKVSNIREDKYALSIMGVAENPIVIFDNLHSDINAQNTNVNIAGRTNYSNIAVHLFASNDDGILWIPLGSAFADDAGEFSFSLQTDELSDGKWAIAAELDEKDELLSDKYRAEGKIILDRKNIPLRALEKVYIAENDGEMTLFWENNNGSRTKGYNVMLENLSTKQKDILYVGNITQLRIPGWTKGDEIKASVASLDEYDSVSSYTSAPLISVGSEKASVNIPVLLNKVTKIKMNTGTVYQGILPAQIDHYQNTGDAAMYLFARETAKDNDAVRLLFDNEIKVVSSQCDIPFTVSLSDDIAPGLYTQEYEVYNIANNTVKEISTIEIEVSYPAPLIESIEPAFINISEERMISIIGRGFSKGIRVLCNYSELPIEKNSTSSVLNVLLPENLEAGEQSIIVENASGDKAHSTVLVTRPDWSARFYTSFAELNPGGQIEIPVEIVPVEGFNGIVNFSVLNAPAFIQMNIPSIQAGESAFITISASKEAKTGTYPLSITNANGRSFEFIVQISAEKLLPRISSLSNDIGRVGDKIEIYGNNFTEQGELSLNGSALSYEQWSDSKITFTIPQGSKTGMLQIQNEAGLSNATQLIVKEMWSLKVQDDYLPFDSGESKEISLYLNGSDTETIEIALEKNNTLPFDISLDKTSTKAPSRILLSIKARESAEAGMYSLALNAFSAAQNTLKQSLIITLEVINSFEITTDYLDEGRIGRPYFAELDCKNNKTDATYSIASGSLPKGIVLSANGIVSGIPETSGLFHFTVLALDGSKKAFKEFDLTIVDDIWLGKNDDSLSLSRVPAREHILFQYKTDSTILDIFALADTIVLHSENAISALNYKGELLWNCAGNYRQIAYRNNKIYLYSDNNVLKVRDIHSGYLIWKREGIYAMKLINDRLYLKTNKYNLVVHADSGHLLQQIDDFDYGSNTTFSDTKQEIFAFEKSVSIEDNKLLVRNLYTANTIWEKEGSWTQLALYNGNLLASEQDTLTVFHGPDNETGPISSIRIVKGQKNKNNWYTEAVKIKIESYDIESYSKKPEVFINNIRLNDDIETIELSENGVYTIAAFAVDNHGMQGNTVRQTIKIDREIPQSKADISGPLGKNNWYTGPVSIGIHAEDAVSGIDTIDTNYGQYTGPIMLNEQGIHQFSWHAVDKAGNKEQWQSIFLNIDYETPWTNAEISNENGYSIIELNSSDALSGLAQIEYYIDNARIQTYSETLVIEEAGNHKIYYRAIDNAGNTERWKCMDFNVRQKMSAKAIVENLIIDGQESVSLPYTKGGFKNMPSYCIGAEYFIAKTASFSVRKDAVVYMLIDNEIQMKRLFAGDTMKITEADKTASIFVQEIKPLLATITVDRKADTLQFDALIEPWKYSRRLPLKEHWYVEIDGNKLEVSGKVFPLPVEIKDNRNKAIKVLYELIALDGNIEYKTEKYIFIGDLHEKN